MPARTVWLALLVFACVGLLRLPQLSAAITAEHQKQIAEIKKELGKVQGLIAKKEIDDAEKILTESEQKLKQIAKDAQVDESHKLISGLLKQIELRKAALTKRQTGADGGPSFEKDVAPILVARCLNCHGDDNPRAGLRLDTFGAIVQGCGGRLIVPGNPNTSMLMQRINAPGNQRMPKEGKPLTADEMKKIAAWISAGAKFTGDNSAPIATLPGDAAGGKVDRGPIEINKPTGGEKVSFKRDIAPFMVNLCVNCHGGANPRAGFSLETFEKLMRGGRGGKVVLPGNKKESRLWHLVGEQDPIKMPPGQALITRSNHRNLELWIEEGAKFDGGDAKAPLRSLVPTDAERRAQELAAMSPEDLAGQRKERASELWQAALKSETPAEATTDSFIVMGNAGESRIKEVADWADEDAKQLKKLFGVKEDQIWKGKLTIFVFKDRFSYSEFVQTNEKAEVPAETRGHAHARPTLDDLYICLEDLGDVPDEENPGARAMVMSLLTEALLLRSANRIPDWATRGTGMALAARSDIKNPYFRGLGVAAQDAVKSLEKPQDVFETSSFSASDLPSVGYTLVSHMIKVGGEPQFFRFLGQLGAGRPFAEVLKEIYSADPPSIARSYLTSLASAKPAPKKPGKNKP